MQKPIGNASRVTIVQLPNTESMFLSFQKIYPVYYNISILSVHSDFFRFRLRLQCLSSNV